MSHLKILHLVGNISVLFFYLPFLFDFISASFEWLRTVIILVHANTHVTVLDVVHGQQVVAVAELELDDVQRGVYLEPLVSRVRSGLTLTQHVLQQQAVFTDALHRLQQIWGQIHLITQQLLLVLQFTSYYNSQTSTALEEPRSQLIQ